ncbi:oligoribonuclease [Corynebacterium pseudodiphtheriticum]|uniref:oligoribonuclease n=1 Tax=Corynebacterium pseudodiphtheriticum TaxID=37637 RepID=UPI0021AF79FA|nr:oligoribonuclease [Corynebacterium pseudodiphtheriticum]MCT1636036.1 oligoribonuclease [Corynebacterium pseudodiphtheriticum]MCT1667152.1 oligoribonuclease [Corynebacterium pseudodiphtheriticum]MDK4207214.1 oligoribonuclease [Corynebacterium pseudodiphtheriticum]MDK4236731.1 oligoribonuclease [Corynebacterium pseudodiphtheriticum]MDK4249827.1 oligoribonuclease [Corynebacterium pseudodiphtheriticum]
MTTTNSENSRPNEDAAAANIPAKSNRMVWIDLEMTGLDPKQHVIVEVAALVTDANLNILGDGYSAVIHASAEELAKMDDVVVRMHQASGLDKEIAESTTSIGDAEQAVLDLIAQHCEADWAVPLAGNSIATDRRFIQEYMPKLDQRLHYRMVDVSTIKELSRRWFPRAYFQQPDKGQAHRALADIVESIRELDYYRRAVFVDPNQLSSTDATRAKEAATTTYQRFL